MTMQINFYTDEELVALWKTFDRLMRGPLRLYIEAYRLALCTGLREFELAKIEVRHCYENYIEIHQGKKKKDRVVDVLPIGIPYYHLYLRERQQQGDKWLFPGRRRNPMELHTRPISTRSLRDHWKAVVEKAGIRYLQPLPLHALRRTFTTWAIDQEWMPLLVLLKQLGHTKIQMTFDHYVGSIPGRKFTKDPPQWLKVAEAGGRKLLEEQGVVELKAWKGGRS